MSSTINKPYYNDIVKPLRDEFEENYGLSPNLYLKKLITDSVSFDPPLEIKNLSHTGRQLNDWVWACYYYKNPEITALPHSYSPQLYVLVDPDGIKFGLDYGKDVAPDSVNRLLTEVVLSKSDLLLL